MRLVLLLIAIGLGIYAYKSFQGPYSTVAAVTTTAGKHYEVLKVPDDCSMIPGTCVGRIAFLTKTRDTVALKQEADGLLPWAQTQGFGNQRKALLLIAIEPGFARLAKPKRSTGLMYAWLRDHWVYGAMDTLPVDTN